jgi:hypothetical protein
VLLASEEWGIPPWVLEEQASAYWMDAWVAWKKKLQREIERGRRQNKIASR